MSETNQKTFLTSNILFMILAYAFIAASLLMGYFEIPFKWTIVIIQYGIIFLPILLVMKFKGVSIKDKFRFKPISIMTGIKAILITVAALPIAYTLNFLVNIILMKLDLFQIQTLDLGTGTFNYFIIVLLIAVTPGIVEEFFFRGMMLSSYQEKMSVRKSIVLTSLFFAVFHFNIQNFMLPFFLGLIFGWMVYITDSIYTSMIAHGVFNFIGSIIMYNNQGGSAEDVDAALLMLDEQAGVVIVGLLIISIFSGGILAGFMYWLKSSYIKVNVNDTIIIKEHPMKVVSIGDDYMMVEHEAAEKKVLFSTLKKLSYKIQQGEKEYGEIDKLNYIAVIMVLALFLGFTFIAFG